MHIWNNENNLIPLNGAHVPFFLCLLLHLQTGRGISKRKEKRRELRGNGAIARGMRRGGRGQHGKGGERASKRGRVRERRRRRTDLSPVEKRPAPKVKRGDERKTGKWTGKLVRDIMYYFFLLDNTHKEGK